MEYEIYTMEVFGYLIYMTKVNGKYEYLKAEKI